jgi:uncharacterized protein (DUF924 family)
VSPSAGSGQGEGIGSGRDLRRRLGSDGPSDPPPAWARDLLDFWFALSHDDWWKGSPELDERIRERFAIEWARQSRRPIEVFLGSPEEALAAVILFDQLPRNMFRGHADQFSTDHMALAIAREAIERGYDDGMGEKERGFLYMPFQHSEDVRDQIQSLLLFTALGDAEQLTYARKHHEVIEKFGRFPHRNAILGRKPTAMEHAAGEVVPW